MDNFLGFVALSAYLATLVPSNIRVIFPALKLSSPVKMLLKYRKDIGVLTFLLSVAHAGVVMASHQMDWLSRDFYIQSLSGLSIIVIFALLAVTSNNWSMKKLRKNWKRLHSLSYVAIFLMPWHIAAKMAGSWTLLTCVAVPLSLMFVYLYCLRKYMERSRKRSKALAPSSTRTITQAEQSA